MKIVGLRPTVYIVQYVFERIILNIARRKSENAGAISQKRKQNRGQMVANNRLLE